MKRNLVKRVVRFRTKLNAKKQRLRETDNSAKKELETLFMDWSCFGKVEDTGGFLDEVRVPVPRVTGRPLSRRFKALLNDWDEFGEVEDTGDFIAQVIRAIKRGGGPALELDYEFNDIDEDEFTEFCRKRNPSKSG
jgi:hypothetical protein